MPRRSCFRARDVAAGGHGAPLAPAFHAAMFVHEHETRVVCNLGGISNMTILDPRGPVRGFDCGPANALLDYWAQRHLGTPFDENGRFAARGQVNDGLLRALLDERAAPEKHRSGLVQRVMAATPALAVCRRDAARRASDADRVDGSERSRMTSSIMQAAARPSTYAVVAHAMPSC
jgi:1,6-anhydro-N-acetylmuramate kinase